jgi:hypothetical protein
MSNSFVRRLASTALAIIISSVALWWLLAGGETTALWKAIQQAEIWPLAIGAVIAILIQMIRAWRFTILATGSLALPSWGMISISSQLVLMNFLLPFKLGELSFPLMMKRSYGTPFGEGAGILILCRLLDFGTVAGIILLGAALLLDPAAHGLNPGLIGAVALLAALSPLFLVEVLTLMKRLFAGRPRVRDLIEQISLGAQRMHPPEQRLLAAVLTVSIWLAHASIAYLTAIAVSAGLGFPPMAMASAASNLAFALPISGVAGLGPPQAAWATVLHLQGVDWTPAITTALICHGVLLTTLSAWGVAMWIGTAALKPTPSGAASKQDWPSASF